MNNMTPLEPSRLLRVAAVFKPHKQTPAHKDHQDRGEPSARHWRFSIFKAQPDRHRAGDVRPETTWSKLLAAKRLLVQRELALLAQQPADSPLQGHETRLENLSTAMCLLRSLGDVVHRSESFVPSGLWPALMGSVELLGESFFTVSAATAVSRYEAIRSCVQENVCLLRRAKDVSTLPDAEAAAKKYARHVESRIREMRKQRGKPLQIDVKA